MYWYTSYSNKGILISHGVSLSQTKSECPWCDREMERPGHLFFTCKFIAFSGNLLLALLSCTRALMWKWQVYIQAYGWYRFRRHAGQCGWPETIKCLSEHRLTWYVVVSFQNATSDVGKDGSRWHSISGRFMVVLPCEMQNVVVIHWTSPLRGWVKFVVGVTFKKKKKIYIMILKTYAEIIINSIVNFKLVNIKNTLLPLWRRISIT